MSKNRTCLHLACGSVYLKSDKVNNWINIDIQLPESYLASEVPQLREYNETDFEHYYKQVVTRDTFLGGSLQHKAIVCDMFADIRYLPYKKESVDEILAVQVFEHFSYSEGKDILKYWGSLLKKGGVMHIDIPDLDGTVEVYRKDPEWGTRLLYGSQKNEYGIHKAMYTRKTLCELFSSVGLEHLELQPNFHSYPAFGLRGIKA